MAGSGSGSRTGCSAGADGASGNGIQSGSTSMILSGSPMFTVSSDLGMALGQSSRRWAGVGSDPPPPRGEVADQPTG
jgi:hypothetical protein